MQPVVFTIEGWEAWAPGRSGKDAWSRWAAGAAANEETAPDVRFVDPMLRRRLGATARMALDVANRCIGDRRHIPVVFASRHGELARTLGMLRDLAKAEDLSPTAFSLSVHNAAAGVFSIARGDHAAATAVSAGPETFGYAVIEAVSRLGPGQKQVLVVYGDDPIPADYAQHVDYAEEPHAVALLLNIHRSAEIGMACEHVTTAKPTEPMSLAFLRFLAGNAPDATWSGDGRLWRWSRHVQ